LRHGDRGGLARAEAEEGQAHQGCEEHDGQSRTQARNPDDTHSAPSISPYPGGPRADFRRFDGYYAPEASGV
jgi:hypothetical protein